MPLLLDVPLNATARSYPTEASGRGFGFLEVLAFAIPCLQFIQFNVVGVLYASELLLAATFLYFVLSRQLRLSTRMARQFLVLCMAWLAAQIVTDFVRHTAFEDYARGSSKILMTMVAFFVLYRLLYGRERRLLLYGWGLVVGSTLEFLIRPSYLATVYPWKFGIAFAATMAVFLLACRKTSHRWFPIVMSVVIGCVNVAAGSRSRGGICLAVAPYLMLTLREDAKSNGLFRKKSSSPVAITVLSALSIAAVLWAYQYAAASGILGYDAQENYERQSAGEYGIMIGGRSAMLGSLVAIYDSPILGHGSWARDPFYELAELQTMIAMGYENTDAIAADDLDQEGYIPQHSFLLGAWVNAGIVGAIFWLWVLLLAVRALLYVHPFASRKLLPLTAFCAISLAWDVVFSPYGTQARILTPFYIVLLMMHLEKARPRTVYGCGYVRANPFGS